MRTRIILIFFLLAAIFSAKPAPASDLALVGAKIYLSPTEPPIENATILVHDGRITAVGPSATTNPAERFGYATRAGRIASGFDADLVVLSSDPAQDVTAFSKAALTIRHGKIIFGKP